MLRHQRRPAAALRRRHGAAAGALRRRHRGHQARAPAPGWSRSARSTRPTRVVVTVSGAGVRAARHRGRLGQGHARSPSTRQGPGHRRRPLPPVPQGRGRARLRLGRRRPAARGRGQRRAGRPARAGRPGATAPGQPGSQPIAACAGSGHRRPSGTAWPPTWQADAMRSPSARACLALLVVLLARLLLSGCGGGRREGRPKSPPQVMEQAKKHFDDASSVHIELSTDSSPRRATACSGPRGDVTHAPRLQGRGQGGPERPHRDGARHRRRTARSTPSCRSQPSTQ